ncbi:hypothetical protein ACOMHN_001637 [Nucella lapillus]
MDQLLKNKEFKAKMVSLSPGVKQWFIDALVDLFEQETEYVIDVLEDCRFELGRTADTYVEEAEHLRATSRMLEERRVDGDRSSSRASLGPALRLPDINHNSRQQSPQRLRNRQRTMVSDSEGRSPSSLSVPGTRSGSAAGRTLSPNAHETRSVPVSPYRANAKTIQEETRALLQTMTDAESHAERERERQQERLERLRRQKKFLAEDRTAQAMKLLEKALEMDRVLAQNRDRQGQMLQNKLQGLKKRRNTLHSPLAGPPDPDDVENC